MWVAFSIRFRCDICRYEIRHLLENDRDIIDDDLTVFITLQKNQLASLLVVVCVNGGYWHFFFNAHVV